MQYRITATKTFFIDMPDYCENAGEWIREYQKQIDQVLPDRDDYIVVSERCNPIPEGMTHQE